MQISQPESRPENRRVLSCWLIVLGLISIQGTLALSHLDGLRAIASMDTAHYYVVAKNISHGDAKPDNVVWHYLGRPTSVERPAGDYWGAGWPYALGFLMRWVGDSRIASFRICAALSLFMPVLVFLLLQRLTSRWWLAAFGAVLVCLQTKLSQVMVTPDVSLSYELTTTAGFVLLLGALKGHPSLMHFVPSAFVLTLPVWLRGDGFVPLLAATIGILTAPWPWRQRLRLVVGFAGVAGICLLPYVAYNIHFFGRISPEARSLTPLMSDYKQLYEFVTQPSSASYWQLGLKGVAGLRVEATKIFADFFIGQQVPYVLVLVATCGPVVRRIAFRRAARRTSGRSIGVSNANFSAPLTAGATAVSQPDGGRAAGIVCLWSFTVLSALVPILIAPIVNNPSRFFTNTAPVLCVLAVWTMEPLLRCRWIVNLALLLVATTLLAYVGWPFHPLKPWATSWKRSWMDIPACLSPGNYPAMNADDVVLTEMPCQLSAQLNVASINMPQDDTMFRGSGSASMRARFVHTAGLKGAVVSAESCRQVIERYHPRFILAIEGSNLEQLVLRLRDLPLRTVAQGRNQDGRGYTWFTIGETASSAPATSGSPDSARIDGHVTGPAKQPR